MIYNGTCIAKTGEIIPLFLDKSPMHSKYNPQKEANNFAVEQKAGFFVVAGIGGGFHIAHLIEENPNSYVLCVEEDENTLKFCLNLPQNANLFKKQNIWACTIENLQTEIAFRYIPALYGDFSLLYHPIWQKKNVTLSEKIKEIVQKALKEIAADFSVQSHFGKIWQGNILSNLQFCSQIKNPTKINFVVKKQAAIIGAGPSLDTSIQTLSKNRDKYTIISTDTAYRSLITRNIFPDIVISVDGQHISHTHFMCCPKSEAQNSPTLFVFALSANPAAAKFVYSMGHSVFFVQSSHPLESLASNFYKNTFPKINSGSGTVTIAACDFAQKLGFSEIELFGADFSYKNGKAYTLGTYLETNFLKEANKLFPQEMQQTNLLFRTELIRKNGILSTEVLESYKNSLNEWIKNSVYFNENQRLKAKENNNNAVLKAQYFPFADFILSLNSGIQNAIQNACIDSVYIKCLLPAVAFFRKNQNPQNKIEFFNLIKLAYTDLNRYTKVYEK